MRVIAARGNFIVDGNVVVRATDLPYTETAAIGEDVIDRRDGLRVGPGEVHAVAACCHDQIALVETAIGICVGSRSVRIDAVSTESLDDVIKNFHVIALVPDTVIQSSLEGQSRIGQTLEVHPLDCCGHSSLIETLNARNASRPLDSTALAVPNERRGTVYVEGRCRSANRGGGGVVDSATRFGARFFRFLQAAGLRCRLGQLFRPQY